MLQVTQLSGFGGRIFDTTMPTIFGSVDGILLSSSSSYSVPVPSSSPDQGLAFMFVTVTGTSPVLTAPADWNLLHVGSAGFADLHVWWKVINGTLTSPTVTSSSSHQWLSVTTVINPDTYRISDFPKTPRNVTSSNIDGPEISINSSENFIAIHAYSFSVNSPYTPNFPPTPSGWSLLDRIGGTSGGNIALGIIAESLQVNNGTTANPESVTYNNCDLAHLTFIVNGKYI